MEAVVVALWSILGALPADADEDEDPARPAAVRVEGVPRIPSPTIEALKRYQDIRSARFVDWKPAGKGMLFATRPENLYQLHHVPEPGAPPRQLTSADEPVSSGRYLSDGNVIFSRGRGGNEDYQIHRLDTSSGEEKLLTDGRSRNILEEPHPDGRRVAFTSTRRNGRDADIYLLDLGTGKAEILFRVERETWWLADWSPDGERAIVSRYISRNESYGAILDLSDRKLTTLPAESPRLGKVQKAHGVSRASFRFGPDAKSVFFVSDARGEFRELARLELETGRTAWLTKGLPWDVGNLVVSPDRRRAAFTVNAEGFSRLYVMAGLEEDQPSIREIELDPCLISGARFSPDGKRLGFTLGRPSQPAEAFSLALESDMLERWTFSERAGFKESDFVTPRLIRYVSFDGRRIPAFVFLPPAAQEGVTRKVPVVITIHGGPESQYRPWFSSDRQYYARELGAAVIAPNVRGSTGYGKTYSLLDNGVKREDSVRDIGALLDWIETTGASKMGLDPGRVAVTGGSYGGYMVLASLLHLGERLRAGVDSVGISDFTTFLENTRSYRRDLRRAEYGDEREPEMQRFFEKISPLRRMDRLRSALFLIHGVNDPRVPFTEALQIVRKARATGQPVWTLYAGNEGHGFSRRENRDYQQAATALFLRDFLLAEKKPAPAPRSDSTSPPGRRRTLGKPLKMTSARGKVIVLELGGPRRVDHVVLAEDTGDGERIRRHVVEVKQGERWVAVAEGGAVGRERIASFEPIVTEAVRLRVVESAATPVLLDISAYNRVGDDAHELYVRAKKHLAAEGLEDAIADLTAAIEKVPAFGPFHLLRSRAHARRGAFEAAARDLDVVLSLDPHLTYVHHLRADALFKLGRFKDAIRDYDRAIAAGEPHNEDSCWERGLAYYYTGDFDAGRRQFEGYHKVGPLDIENGIWRYLCIAEKDGLEKALKTFYPYPRKVRPPFAALHDLYSGKGSAEAVLAQATAAARSDAETERNLFYGHYYSGKYFEVTGKLEKAKEHVEEALRHRESHFMYHCARMDLERLRKANPSGAKR